MDGFPQRCPHAGCAGAIRAADRFCAACGRPLRAGRGQPTAAATRAPENTNAAAPQTLRYAAAPRSPRRGVLFACIVFLWLGWATCVVAELLIVGVDVESVMGTGPTVLGLGLITMILGLVARRASIVLMGLANCGVAVLFCLLVLILDWSPREAKEPFAVMGGIYTLLSLPMVIVASVGLIAARRRPAAAG